MKRHLPTAAGKTPCSHVSRAWLALAIILATLRAATGAMAQTGGPTDPAAVVDALTEAMNRGDVAGVLSFIDPTCRMVVGPHSSNREERTCGVGAGQWPGSPPWPHVELANLRTTGPETAENDVTLSGGNIPPTSHPFTVHATFTVKNGRITQLLDRLSPQLEQELAALPPPPGTPAPMPSTGAGDIPRKTVLLVLGLICGLIGTGFRRTSLRSR